MFLYKVVRGSYRENRVLKSCGGCGLIVGDEARFCSKCGHQFATGPQSTIGVPTVVRWTPKRLFLIAVLVVFGLAVVGNLARDDASPTVKGSAAHVESATPKARTTVLNDLKLDFTWHKDGFDSIMIANFTIENKGPQAAKDFEIECTHSANSGTVIDRNTRTIYEVVKPNSKKRFANFNMGFIHSQATRSGCSITNFKVAE